MNNYILILKIFLSTMLKIFLVGGVVLVGLLIVNSLVNSRMRKGV